MSNRLLASVSRREVAVCHTCRLHHICAPGSDEAVEFMARHKGHRVAVRPADPLLAKVARLTGADLFRQIARRGAELVLGLDRLGVAGYSGNANVKQAFGSVDTFAVTNLHSKATSATAGWMSAAVDSTTNLYDDYFISVVIAAVNTAPANSKASFVYAYGLTDDSGTDYTSSGDGTPSGSEGNITFPDITTLPVVMPVTGIIPYPVQNKLINGGPFGQAKNFDAILPPKHGVCIINHTGMTFAASGNTVKGRGLYYTVS